MTVSDAVRRTLKKGKVSQTELGRRWGTTPQVINNKLRLNQWSGAELMQVASFAEGKLGIIYPDGAQLLIDPPAEEEKE